MQTSGFVYDSQKFWVDHVSSKIVIPSKKQDSLDGFCRPFKPKKKKKKKKKKKQKNQKTLVFHSDSPPSVRRKLRALALNGSRKLGLAEKAWCWVWLLVFLGVISWVNKILHHFETMGKHCSFSNSHSHSHSNFPFSFQFSLQFPTQAAPRLE